jgi:hypothetical protein
MGAPTSILVNIPGETASVDLSRRLSDGAPENRPALGIASFFIAGTSASSVSCPAPLWDGGAELWPLEYFALTLNGLTLYLISRKAP